MSITTSSFTCKRDNLTIRGMQYLPTIPSDTSQYPAVIICHGFTGNYSDMEDWCADFAQLGYAAFCFSFCGGSSLTTPEEFLSDGTSIDMTISSEIDDLVCVKEYVQQLPYVDSKHLILVGGSQGGLVAALTAARYSSEIEKLILFFPAFCIPDHARKGRLADSRYNPGEAPNYIDCHTTILGKAYHDEVSCLDPYLEIAKYTGPVLLLQGLNDDVVHYSYAIRAKNAYRKGQCHLQLIRNMGHRFCDYQHDSALASIRQFLQNRQELFSFRILVTHSEETTIHDISATKIYFIGHCESELFQGCICDEGCDTRIHYPDHTQVCAEYTLNGLDASGATCYLHVVNQWKDGEWRPVIKTNSKALSFLNTADLTAVLDYAAGGPTVRIFK